MRLAYTKVGRKEGRKRGTASVISGTNIREYVVVVYEARYNCCSYAWKRARLLAAINRRLIYLVEQNNETLSIILSIDISNISIKNMYIYIYIIPSIMLIISWTIILV